MKLITATEKMRVHCLFEQSGTFKNEFRKLGYEAFDYDIQNNFGQTDHQMDIFHEIEEGFENRPSIFDDIAKDDLIMAFFPCIYFEALQMTYYDFSAINLRGKTTEEKYREVIERIGNRERFLILLYKLCGIVETRGLRMIIENPATQPHYLLNTQTFVKKPTLIDKDRSLRGDFFRKPTAYWFFNIEPTFGESFRKNIAPKVVSRCKSSPLGGGLVARKEV